MKVFIAIISLFVSTQVFAAQLNCSKQVSEARTESTNVRSWPELYIGRGYIECETSQEGPTICRNGLLERIADPYSVCFQDMDVKNDCRITEKGDYSTGLAFAVDCKDGTSLGFTMEPGAGGKLVCVQNGNIMKSWDLGLCTEE